MRSFLSVLIAFFLLITLVPAPMYGEENPPTDRGDGVYENSGDWVIEEGEDIQHSGRTIVVNGNLTVLGTLTLTGCELVMNSSYSTLSVPGTLNLDTTNVSGNGTGSYYYFIITGVIDFRDSNIRDVAGSTTSPYIGGLQIFSENVTMIGCSIMFNEFTGIYIASDVRLEDTTITSNPYNLVVNGSSPDLVNCTIRQPGSVNIFMVNGSSPLLIQGDQGGEIKFDDEVSSLSYGHQLHVHVTFENGTSIPDVPITATSSGGDITEFALTDEDGWVRNLVLPEETIYKTIPDQVFRPYKVSAKKFGLEVLESVPFQSETTLHMILSGDYFGEEITRGDYNGDGLMDLAVGVPRNRTGLDVHGAVFVFLNKGDLEFSELSESMADLTIHGIAGTGFGTVLDSGDVNGDGYDDLLASTPFSDGNGAESGSVLFFLGKDTPDWDSLSDAEISLKGEPGSHLGLRTFVGNLNNDAYMDFIIGDDLHSYIYYGITDIKETFTGVSEVHAYPTEKGPRDITGEPLSDLRYNDNERYHVDSPPPHSNNNKLHVKNYTVSEINGLISAVTLEVEHDTSQYYGYNNHERNYIWYRIGKEGEWKPTFEPTYQNQNELLTFDLYADGVTTRQQLDNIEFYHKNSDGTENGSQAAGEISFDYIHIHVVATGSGPNHTLMSGNLTSGDVNGDGFPDVIISDISGQNVFFGGPLGISAPEILETDLGVGDSSNLRERSGELTISETRPYLNGQWDDRWNGWSQDTNSYGVKDNGVRWSIVESSNGDWHAHEGATGGFGSDQDSLDSGNNRDCRGMLRTGDFLVTDDMETIHFWYKFGARSFERAGGNQGQVADQIRYRLYSSDDDSVLMELAGWTPSGQSEGYDEDGTVDEDITSLRGQEVYFGIEIISNRGQSDRAIAQIDNLTILPPSAIPYYEDGNLVSDWFDFIGNISSITPSWTVGDHSENITIRFRTDNATDWNDTTPSENGVLQTTSGTEARFQYRIEMTGDGISTPSMSDLRIGVLLEGQIMPLSLMTDYGQVSTGDMDGDDTDDLLFLDEGSGRAQGIDVYYGHSDIAEAYNPSNIQDLYNGDLAGFSVLDLESDGTDELALIGDSISIIDSNSDVLWENMAVASKISGDTASDLSHHLNVGSIYFIPSHDHDIIIPGIEIPSLVDPGVLRSVNVTIGNLATEDASGLTLFLNITADGYSTSDSRQVALSSMEMSTFEFLWDVPSDEGVNYMITAEVHLDMDRVTGNNMIDRPVTSKQHGIELDTVQPVDSEHGGDEFVFHITVRNIGTFEFENVTLDSLLPQDWSGEFRIGNLTIDHIVVYDSASFDLVASSIFDEDQGDFTINLTGTAVTAVSYLDLTATILRPDLVIDDIQLLREDGVQTNATTHGVVGDLETIRILVTNHGPTYATGFTLALSKDGGHYEDFIHDGLLPGESVWFSTAIVPDEGVLSLSAEVDTLGEVPEEDENNNDLSEEFTIKGTDPVGSYNLSGIIRNIEGEGVALAEVILEWDGNSETVFTDDNGTFSYLLDAVVYLDTSILILNGTDGENITSVTIILYSEDGGKFLDLTLNQYVVEITGPDTVSPVAIGSTINLTLQVTNLGNVNATFIVVPLEVPEDWTVSLPDLVGGVITLSIDETAPVILQITSSADPLLARGNQRYYFSVQVYPEIYPAGNDIYLTSAEAIPLRSILVTTDGGNTTSAQPGEEVDFNLIVENIGNVDDTFIPELLGSSVQEFGFDISYANLDIGDQTSFSISLTMPMLASGTDLDIQVGGPENHIRNADIRITALDFYGIECESSSEFEAEPDNQLTIPLSITNAGNLQEIITISVWSEDPDITIEDEYLELVMGQNFIYDLMVTIPTDALSGEVIPLTVNLTSGPVLISIPMNITVLEVYGLTLTLLDTIIEPRTDLTIYSYEMKAENTGNGMNTFHFKAEGTHPGYLSLPDPITLDTNESTIIYAEIVVPFNRTGVIDNYIVPVDMNRVYVERDLNLRILSYEPDLETEVRMSQGHSIAEYNDSVEGMGEGPIYFYDVTVTNLGERFERITIEPKIPESSGYEPGEAQWMGRVNKEFLEIYPGESAEFRLWLTTPERKIHYGTDLSVVLRSESEKSQDLPLHKPPIAIIGVSDLDEVTFEDFVTFTGSQSVWNILEYFWDFGDGSTSDSTTEDHTFGKSGIHTVTLTVTDDMNFTATSTVTVGIGNMAPIAVIQAQPLDRTVEIDEPIKLDAKFSQDRDGEVVSFRWEFGEYSDFYEGLWPIIEHSYEIAGVYTITLHVTDNMGNTTNTTTQVTVTEESDDPEDPIEPEVKETTDPLTYVPFVLVVLVAIIGAVVIMRRRMFIEHVVNKIHKIGKK